MKKVILRYGLLATIVMIAFFFFNFAVGKQDYNLREILGYAAIILSLLFVYFGIRQYRDKVNGGVLSFGQGLKVGMLIVLLPAIAFGLFDLVYVAYIDPNFFEEYTAYHLASIKSSLPPAEYEIQSKKMMEELAFFKNNPLIQFIVMAATVLIVGLIITIISSLILRRNKPAIA